MTRIPLVAMALAACACSIARSPFSSATPDPPPSATIGSVAEGSLEGLLKKSPRLARALDQAASTRLQILLSVPSSGGGGLRREGFRVDAEYFYPASAIKLCVAVAALEALTELREGGNSSLDASAVLARRSAPQSSIAALVERALVISDNEANNDLFDLVGFDGIHERMWRMGLSTFRMHHRLDASPGDDARATPQLSLVGPGSVIIPARQGSVPLGINEGPGTLVGESHFAAGRWVEGPMSFAEKNFVSLVDLQTLLIAVMRPDLRPDGSPRLGPSERALLLTSLSALPSDRGSALMNDAEHKPLLAGIERVVPRTSLTVASKGGRAYGFVVDNAYVADARTGSSFFLSATIYTNDNGTLNDDVYEYWDRAFPLLADVGEVVARAILRDPR